MLNPASNGAPTTTARLTSPASLGMFKTVASFSNRARKMVWKLGLFDVLGCLYGSVTLE